MTEKKENKGKATLSLGKKLEAGTVKQNLSRMRSKTVTVEVKKSKFAMRKSPEEESGLSKEEFEARKKILENASKKSNASEVVYKTSVEVKKDEPEQQEEVAASQVEEKAEEAPKPQTPKSYNNKDFVGLKSVTVVNNRPETDKTEYKIKKNTVEAPKKESDKKFSKPNAQKESVEEAPRKSKGKMKGGDDKWNKKLTLSQAIMGSDAGERMRSVASIKRQRKKLKKQNEDTEQVFKEKTIIIPEFITVQELANRMAVRVQDVIKELMKLGMINRATDEIDADTAELIVSEFNHVTKRVLDSDIESILSEEEAPEAELVARPPVVTIMGHVDHGKTSLLDALRNADIVSGEAGGITQHIGAYQITTKAKQKVTFLDTPGHAAFTAMRARGATATDIVILVVAADDGVMPQTIEAINHAKAAEVPIIVAVNKIDKPDANPKKVVQELSGYEVVSEEFGGDVQTVEISAKTKQNLDALLDAVLLQAEILDLKASEQQKPRGVVIESKIDKGRGVVATLLVQKGTLKVGDLVVAGTAFARVKSIINDKGENLEEALPSMPVEILGFDEVPSAGEIFAQVDTDKQGKDIVEYRKKLELVEKTKAESKGSLESLFEQANSDGKELNIIVRGDVHGSIEAINGSIAKIESDEVTVKIVHSAAGAVTESDVQLAISTKSIILGFNVRAEANAKQLAEKEGVEIRYYNIIYNLLDDIKAIVSGMLSPVIREEYLGSAEILQVFKITKSGKIAGTKVKDGIVKRGAGVRLIRDNVVIHEGKLKTLKRFKDEVPEVREGFECGMAFENYEDIKENDVIEAFETVSEARTLD